LVEWNPGLNNEAHTLRAAYQQMPREGAPAIPWYVKLFENPASPFALPGAAGVFAHDCIHILLGRGTLPQDEAFVVGFTMGASGDLTLLQRRFFVLFASLVYRGSYRFSRIERRIFNIAVNLAIRIASSVSVGSPA